MRKPTTREITPSFVVAVMIVGGEFLTHASVDHAVLAVGYLLKAAGGLGILFALYRLAPWLRGK
jgi:hypothetical protein